MNTNSTRCDSGQTSDAETDGDLLNRFYAGDADALGELANRLGGRLFGRAIRLIPERSRCRRHRAEEMVADVFLRVIKTRGKRTRWVSGRASVMGWMGTILRNAILGQRWREWPASVDSLEIENPDRGDSGYWESQLVRQEQLAGAMTQLPKTDRDILTLKGQGVKQNAIAQRLGLSTAKVTRRVRAATETVRALVREGGNPI